MNEIQLSREGCKCNLVCPFSRLRKSAYRKVLPNLLTGAKIEKTVGGGLLVPTSINGPCGPLSNLDISFLQHVRLVSHLCSSVVAAPPILAPFHRKTASV